MGRNLEGTVKVTTAGTWRAEVPAAFGSNKRVTSTFKTKAEAEAWKVKQISLLTCNTNQGVRKSKTRPVRESGAVSPVVDLETMVNVKEQWLNTHFVRNNRGQHSRHQAADFNIRQFIEYYNAMKFASPAEITPPDIQEYLQWLAGTVEVIAGLKLDATSRPFLNGFGYEARSIRTKATDIGKYLQHGVMYGAWTINPDILKTEIPVVTRQLEADIKNALTWEESAGIQRSGLEKCLH